MTPEASALGASMDPVDTVPLIGRPPEKAALTLSEVETGKCHREGRAWAKPPLRERPLMVLPPLEEFPSSREVEPLGDALESVPQNKHESCSSLQQSAGCGGCSHSATSGMDRTCKSSPEQSFAKLSSQAELIECRMSMLLIEVGQLCGHMDKSIGVLKQIQKQQNRQQAQNQQTTQQQTQQPAQQQTQSHTQQQIQDLSQQQTQEVFQEMVASISSNVCSHLDTELTKMLQQHEQQVNRLFEQFRASLNDVRTPRDTSYPPKLCIEQQMAAPTETRPRAATESPRRSWPQRSAALLARERQPCGRLEKSASTHIGGDACYLFRTPRNQALKPLPLGRVDTTTDTNRRPSTPASDNTELGDDGLSVGNSPNSVIFPCGSRSTNLWGERVQGSLHHASVELTPAGSPLTSSWRTSQHRESLRTVLHRVTRESSPSRHSSRASWQPKRSAVPQQPQEVPEATTTGSSVHAEPSCMALSNSQVGLGVVRSRSGDHIPRSLAYRNPGSSMVSCTTDVPMQMQPRRSFGSGVAVQGGVTNMQMDGASSSTSERREQERTPRVR